MVTIKLLLSFQALYLKHDAIPLQMNRANKASLISTIVDGNRNVIDYINDAYKTSRQLQEENLRLQEQLRLLLERLGSAETQTEKNCKMI